MSTFAYGAYVAAVIFDAAGSGYVCLGDGTVQGPGGARQVHEGAVLCAAPHPSGVGVLTGGDDGQVCWTRPDGGERLYARQGRWIDSLDASAATGLVAFACGRDLHVRDVADPGFHRLFPHERSVASVAFEPKGRRIAAATYGGVALWYARIESQKPQVLKWAGSHIGVAWSPNARFIVSAMQENALHGWRLSDAKDMRMGGYPSKVRSLAFLADGLALATSGAAGAVIWPFGGANGPMGKAAAEVGYQDGVHVTRVAATLGGRRFAVGLSDGRVWLATLGRAGVETLAEGHGAPISALAMTQDGSRLAFGDEAGAGGFLRLPIDPGPEIV